MSVICLCLHYVYIYFIYSYTYIRFKYTCLLSTKQLFSFEVRKACINTNTITFFNVSKGKNIKQKQIAWPRSASSLIVKAPPRGTRLKKLPQEPRWALRGVGSKGARRRPATTLFFNKFPKILRSKWETTLGTNTSEKNFLTCVLYTLRSQLIIGQTFLLWIKMPAGHLNELPAQHSECLTKEDGRAIPTYLWVGTTRSHANCQTRTKV